MNTAFDPLVSEFESSEQEEKYNTWLQAKIDAANVSTNPTVPHDEAMARVRLKLKQLQHNRKNDV